MDKQKKISVVTRSQTITSNTTLMPEGFGGYYAQNNGTGNVIVDGHILEPGAHLDFSSMAANVVWSSPIVIVCETGGELRITRFLYAINE